MIINIDIRNREIAETVLELQLNAYQVEAEIINYQEIPPLKDTVETLEHSGETFYGYLIDGKLCGLLALQEENDVVDIHRLVVHPDYFRRGIAQRLLNFLEDSFTITKIKVATASRNGPAIKLYKKNDFKITNEIIVNEQLSLTQLEKML